MIVTLADLYYEAFGYFPESNTNRVLSNLQTVIALLPERLRTAVRLRCIDHLPLQKVGNELHISKQGTVYVLDKVKQTLSHAPYSWLVLNMVQCPAAEFPQYKIDPSVIRMEDWSICDTCTDTRIVSALQRNHIHTVDQFLSSFGKNKGMFDEAIERYMVSLHSEYAGGEPQVL